jgi:hypothetical protein
MKEVKVYHYENAELTASLITEHQILIKKSKDLAIDLAGRNLPQRDVVSVDPYTGSLREGYNRMIQKSKQVLNPENQGEQLDIEEDDHVKEVHIQEEKIGELANKVRIKENELSKSDNSLEQKARRWNRFYKPFTWVVILADIAISGVAIEQLHYPKWVSLLLASCIGFSILMLSHHLPAIINKGKTPRQKKALAITVLGASFIIFLVLGFFRSMALKEAHIGHAFGFSAINFFFLLVATAVSHFNRPTEHDYKTIDAYKLIQEQHKHLSLEKERLELEFKHLNEAFREKEDLRKRIIQYAKDTELTINSMWFECYNDFVQTNLFHRKDGSLPEAFAKKPEPLTMYYQNQL